MTARWAGTPELNPSWFQDYGNIIILTSFMADRGDSGSDIAYAIEKPWKFEDDFQTARADLAGDVDAPLVLGAKDGHDDSVPAEPSRTCVSGPSSAAQ